MIKANEGLVDSIAKVTAEIKALPDSKTIKIDVDAGGALAEIAAVKAALDGLGDKHISIGDSGGMLRELRDISASMDQVTSSMGRMEDHMVAIKRDVADSSADLMMQTQILRDNADAHNAAADAVAAHAAAHQNAGSTYIRMGGGGGGHGGGGDGTGSGGGGLGFYGSGAFVPWRGGGFQAIKFWGMAIAEFAATAVPALIAAGAASAVGMKGAEDTILRAKAIATTASALGSAYGVTTGSYLGLSGTLGRAQAADRGGVYELAGAGINFLNAGSGAFTQLGTSTLSMIDRGTANMLLNYKARQAKGGGLGDMLGGGTEWLRRYGDLFGNLGDTVMNLAPYEPGLGGDVLNSLVGGTGLLKQITQDVPGPILGTIMAAEGGSRWGKALLGGKGLLGRVLGLRKVGGIGGLIGKAGEGLGLEGLEGFGAGLADLGFPELAGLSAVGFLGSELISSMPSSAQRQVAGLQAEVGRGGFSGAWQPLAHAITMTRGLSFQGGGGPGADMLGTNEAPSTFARFGPIGPTTRQVYQAATTTFGQTMDDLINAGPQLVDALHKAGIKSVSMGEAFQIAQNALLDTTHAFGKDGKLNQTAQTMLSNYAKGIAPMTQSGGAFNAAIAGQQIMSSGRMQALSQVNQAMDSMTQIMTAGPAGMATLFGMLGGTPITHKLTQAGLQLSAPPAYAKMAQALTSFTSASGASAWNTFAGSQGLIAAEQANLDQLRTGMTLGAIGPGGAAGLAGFQLQQLLPMARKSPAALAMVMQQEAQMGIGGYYDTSKSQAQNYQAAVKATAQVADNNKQANKAMNDMTVHLSNLPQMAKQFSQGFNADVMSKQVAAAATSFSQITAAAQKGVLDKGAISGLTGQLKAAFGGDMGAVRAQIQSALSSSGLSAGMQRKIMLQVDANTSQAQAKINAIHGKIVQVLAHDNAAQVQSAINAIHGKTVQVVVQAIMQGLPVGLGAMKAAGFAPGVSSSQIAENIRKSSSFQTGGLVPGSGSGDIIPAMLEPGEVVVPRNLVGLVAPILAAHRVPGFGGMPQGASSHFAAGGIVPSGNLSQINAEIAQAWKTLDQLYKEKDAGDKSVSSQISAFWKDTLDPLYAQRDALRAGGSAAGTSATAVKLPKDFSFALSGEIAKEIKNSAGAKQIATALMTKIAQEISYAHNVASAAMSGQGFGNAGIFGSMDVTPGTGNGTVMEQMQSYLTSVQSFTKDIGTLRKDHLNKAITAQLIGAGPVQGDALAQSILGGYGGVKGVNQLWAQLGHATKGLGNQAELAQYGGLKASSANVTININAGSGGAAGLNLTAAQIKQIVAQVQAALLKQAKRNPKTGIQLAGKGA